VGVRGPRPGPLGRVAPTPRLGLPMFCRVRPPIPDPTGGGPCSRGLGVAAPRARDRAASGRVETASRSHAGRRLLGVDDCRRRSGPQVARAPIVRAHAWDTTGMMRGSCWHSSRASSTVSDRGIPAPPVRRSVHLDRAASRSRTKRCPVEPPMAQGR
jgi:hypothetical protein